MNRFPSPEKLGESGGPIAFAKEPGGDDRHGHRLRFKPVSDPLVRCGHNEK